jgi:hypothetical protein
MPGAIAGIAAIVTLIIASKHRTAQESPVQPAQNTQAPETSETTPAAPEPISQAPTTATMVEAVASTNADRLAVTRELIKRMSEVEMQPGGVTPESAARWNRDFESLVEQGTAVITPLEEFFQSKVDVRFDTGKTNLLDEPSLRIAFMHVLFNIPAPENVNLQEQLLRETADPAEVALLAQQLEAQEPGKYQGLIVYEAQLALDQANRGQWPGRDTKPLLKILKASEGAGGK